MTAIDKIAATIFEQIRKVDENGVEFWNSRDLSKVLQYADYRNFQTVIDKAKEACANSAHKLSNHFVDLTEMVEIGSGAVRELDSVKLSRYACYLIVQNANPSKQVVAMGQIFYNNTAF